MSQTHGGHAQTVEKWVIRGQCDESRSLGSHDLLPILSLPLNTSTDLPFSPPFLVDYQHISAGYIALPIHKCIT